MKTVLQWILVLGFGVAFICIARPATVTDTWAVYDPNPNHLWNRLHRALYLRQTPDGHEYGYDELDPLLWGSSKSLLTEPANGEALKVLDEFLATHGERAIDDPLKRAMLQRDLWAIFDWTTCCFECTQRSTTTAAAKLNLQARLVQVMKRLALSPQQIAALPDMYKQAVDGGAFAKAYDPNKREQAFLPADLFDAKGPWVALSLRGGDLIAPGHASAFSGRSVFLVFIRLPEGRAATLDYLKTLSAFRNPWLLNAETQRLIPNPDLPEFPAGTQLALVRRMVLVDANGDLRPTNVVEDVQIRVHRSIPTLIPRSLDLDRNDARDAMDVYEFKLTRMKLFAGEAGGLHSLTKTDTEFPLFRSHDIDLFEKSSGPLDQRMLRVSLQACASCHFQPGIHSVLSRSQRFANPENIELLPSWEANREADATRWWKGRQFNWGLLQGLWNSSN